MPTASRGCRNPWDITFDDGFNWFGTDNDQTQGDKIFAPFFGADFGWGHPWSYAWKGDQHWPSAPSSGPLFEGSGTGVIHLGLERYPENYRGVYLINDWLKRQVYVYRPQWNGAWMQPAVTPLPVMAEAGSGRSMQRSTGRAFDPVDIELGPDGAIYISSWGREYGLREQNGKQVNEGRIYRLWPKEAAPRSWTAESDLFAALGSPLPVWRSDAQAQLVKEGRRHFERLQAIIADENAPRQLVTWAAWTRGQIETERAAEDAYFVRLLENSTDLNRRMQALRILAFRHQVSGRTTLPDVLGSALGDPQPRVRHEAVLAIRQVGDRRFNDQLIERAAVETDRIVFYSVWGSMRSLFDLEDKRALLADRRVGVRRAAALAMLEDDLLTEAEIAALESDADPVIAELGRRRSGGKAEAFIKGAPLGSSATASASTAGQQASRPPTVVDGLRSVSGRPYEIALLRDGVNSYTDRKYKIGDVPAELGGLPFVRVANDDADEGEGKGFEVELLYPATLWLADDERGEALPRWAREQFKPSALAMRGERKMKLYQREVPAGKVRFGSNRADVRAAKAHYLVIIQPILLQPQTTLPTAATVEAKLAGADVERGRTLFLAKGGAGCAACHRMEGVGNVFAPDLSDIGSRADAGFIIRSILEPSADITEGFALQTVTRKDGSSVAGIVLEETARALRLGGVGGQTVEVRRSDIAKREAAKVSAMPPVGLALSAQQNADLTAYLLASKAKPAAPGPRLVGGGRVSFLVHDDRVDIRQDAQPIMTYYLRTAETKRPFFAHVKTPSGLQVTRNFPPVEGVDPTDHASMHPGLSLGFAVLDGENFWHNNGGEVVHHGFEVEPVAGDHGGFTVRNRYLRRDGRPVCDEIAAYRFIPNEAGYLITMDHRFRAERAFHFGVREEMGLAVRVATPIRVKNGGRILSRKKGRNERGTWGIVDRWWDYAGSLRGRHAGLQLMTGSGNPDIWSHSRDYGLLVANPFPVDRPENRDIKTTVEAGQTFRLRFGVQVHEHGEAADYDPAAAFRFYLREEGGKSPR